MWFDKTCITCRDGYCLKGSSMRCSGCDHYSLWVPPYWLIKWLNSFDTDSATKCFEAVNILKERLEDEVSD